jgi:hypothetical protein
VNIAARLESLAEPGGICISRSVRDPVRDKLGFSFEDMGEQELKNIAAPIHAFRVRFEGAEAAERLSFRATQRRNVVAACVGGAVAICAAGIALFIWLGHSPAPMPPVSSAPARVPPAARQTLDCRTPVH